MDRKRFFKKGLRNLASDLYNTPLGKMVDRQLQGLANLVDPQGLHHYYDQAEALHGIERLLVRPPGALPEEEFQKACTACGDCIEACPHAALFVEGDSGPMLEPSISACLLCEDYPCIAACNDGALLPLASDELPAFGIARVDAALCINSDFGPKIPAGQKLCRDCINICPVPGAIKMGRNRLPAVSDACTGCGQCVAACPTYPVAIKIAHYIDEEDQIDLATLESHEQIGNNSNDQGSE